MSWTPCRSTFLFLFAVTPWLGAEQERLTAKQMGDAIFIETVSTPTPSEFFLALGKQSQPNWNHILRPTLPVANRLATRDARRRWLYGHRGAERPER